VPLPEGSSSGDSDSSSSSSDSDADDEKEDVKKKAKSPKKSTKAKKEASPSSGSDSSVTLDTTIFPVSENGPLPPDPTKSNNRGKGGVLEKKTIEPFSRVRKDVKVDPRLASNEFIARNDVWGQKAHEDLIVTKGKGFTKEKNKKKKGSYRGGPIDTSVRGGIKFDD